MAMALFNAFLPEVPPIENRRPHLATPATVATELKTVAGVATVAAPRPPNLVSDLSDAGNHSAAIWTAAHEERAAIAEYDGGAPREWAEGFASLDRTRPPD